MAWFTTFLIYAAITVALELIRPTPDFEDAKPAGLGDFNFPTATEGRRVPVVWGTVRIEGPNVVWYGDLTQEPIEETVRVSMFKKKTYIRGFKYYVGMQFALCRGVVDNVRRLWMGEDLVFDGTSTPAVHGDTISVDEEDLYGGDELGNGGFVGDFEVFTGTTTQTASSYLSTFQDEGGDTPAYRRTAYLAPASEAFYVGTSTSIRAPKFEVQRIEGCNGLSLATPSVNTLDANPANVLYEVLTDNEWGMGLPTGNIDTASFIAAASTLASEGNGFSFILDRPEKVSAMIERVLFQIDGVLYQDLASGDWTLALARDDYSIGSIATWDDSTIVEVRTWGLGTWEQTTNNVSLQFRDRDDDYKLTYATAQDMANMRIRDGEVVKSDLNHPGVMDPTLANAIVWRDLRTLATPLVQATVVTDRTTYGTKPGDAVLVSFTRGDLSVTERVMRVKRIDAGSLLDGRIVYELVEDIFRSEVGSFGDPSDTGWTAPTTQVVAFPADEQIAIEAPRGLVMRDPDSALVERDLILFGARRQTSEVYVEAWARQSAGTPSGDYAEIGTAAGLFKIGALASALSAGDSVPTSTITLDSTPDTQTSILSEFAGVSVSSEFDLNANMTTLIMVDDEMMLVESASAGSGSQVTLTNVYRGVLDTVQADHASGADVYLLFAGVNLSDDALTPSYNVDVKLLPRSYYGVLDIASATAISLTMQNRVRRPYPPSRVSLGASWWASTIGLESGGLGESDGIVAAWTRRDFRSSQEIMQLDADAGSLFSDFPSANSHETKVEVINDPDGTPASLFTVTVGATDGPSGDGTDYEIPRVQILQATGGVLPTRLRLSISGSHVHDSTSYDSLYPLIWDFDVTSTMTGYQELGVLDNGDVSNVFTADTTGNHTVAMTTFFTSGNVEYRLNGGSWTTIITAGTKSGVISGVTSGDTIELRHLSTDTGALKLLNILSAGADGFAVLFT